MPTDGEAKRKQPEPTVSRDPAEEPAAKRARLEVEIVDLEEEDEDQQIASSVREGGVLPSVPVPSPAPLKAIPEEPSRTGEQSVSLLNLDKIGSDLGHCPSWSFCLEGLPIRSSSFATDSHASAAVGSSGASRRKAMVRFSPDDLSKFLTERCPPDVVLSDADKTLALGYLVGHLATHFGYTDFAREEFLMGQLGESRGQCRVLSESLAQKEQENADLLRRVTKSVADSDELHFLREKERTMDATTDGLKSTVARLQKERDDANARLDEVVTLRSQVSDLKAKVSTADQVKATLQGSNRILFDELNALKKLHGACGQTLKEAQVQAAKELEKVKGDLQALQQVHDKCSAEREGAVLQVASLKDKQIADLEKSVEVAESKLRAESRAHQRTSLTAKVDALLHHAAEKKKIRRIVWSSVPDYDWDDHAQKAADGVHLQPLSGPLLPLMDSIQEANDQGAVLAEKERLEEELVVQWKKEDEERAATARLEPGSSSA